jgi:hypothetical protein
MMLMIAASPTSTSRKALTSDIDKGKVLLAGRYPCAMKVIGICFWGPRDDLPLGHRTSPRHGLFRDPGERLGRWAEVSGTRDTDVKGKLRIKLGVHGCDGANARAGDRHRTNAPTMR